MQRVLIFGSALLGLVTAAGLVWATEVSRINRTARAMLDRAGHREYVTQISPDRRCKSSWTVYFISMHSPIDHDYKGYLCVGRSNNSVIIPDDTVPFDINV